ncbi:MAG TPA: ABC transporter permease [Candidatus Angelobacter sp.]
MKLLASLRSLAATLFRRSNVEAEMEAELRSHIQQRANDLERSGLARSEAERQARIEFGGYQKFKEECREALGTHLLHTFLQDVRYGLRMLRKSPGFTSVAVLTLALGIGANTAMFSVVYAVLLRPLPFKDPARLMVLHETTPRVGTVSVSYPNFLDWRAQNHTFSQMAAVEDIEFNLAGVSQPESISGYAVSPNFLSLMGVRPLLGRDFSPSEEKPGTTPVVLLSYELWQSHLGGDHNAIGRTITLDDRNFTIVGVLPPDYKAAEKLDVMIPIGVWATNNSELNERGNRGDSVVVARLAPNSGEREARAEMEGIAARLAKEYPATNDQCGVLLQPLRDSFVGDTRPAILVLFSAVMFVLLIASANVANLFLVRGAGRTREIAMRVALGASRSRIIRQILTESFVLACLGGILGLGLSVIGIRGILRLISAGALMGTPVGMNGPVLLFAAGIVVASAFIFGLAPAAQSAKADPQSELKDGAATTSAGASQNRLRDALAIAEISLALILLVGAGLMIKSLYRLLSVDPGFRVDRVLTMRMNLRTAQYAKDAQVVNFWQRVLDGVRTLPGVESATVGTVVPLTDDHNRTDITIENMALPQPGSFPHPDVHVVSPGYVSTLGIPLLRGRTFADADNEKAPLVGMVNAMLAKQYFGKDDPIGKRFMLGHPNTDKKKWIMIVGMVADTRLYGLAQPARLEIYLPYQQFPSNAMELLTRSAVDPATLTSAIRNVVASIDKNQPINNIATMDQLVSDDVSIRRITLILLGMFSGLALLLAAIGIYGVLSYAVALRTREIGIRLALGAQRADVLRLVIGQGVRLAVVGVTLGLLTALALTRLMSTLLFGVSANDPLTFASVAVVLTIVALTACYIPARRAMRVDPIIALRYE